jgi:hypothetical protein
MFAAYSDVSDDNAAVGMNNVSTQNQTKLYTGAGLNGMLLAQGSHINVAAPDTTAWTVGVDTTVSGVTLMAEYTADTTGTAPEVDQSMWAVAAVTNVAGIDLLAGATAGDTGAIDVTAVRITAGLKF